MLIDKTPTWAKYPTLLVRRGARSLTTSDARTIRRPRFSRVDAARLRWRLKRISVWAKARAEQHVPQLNDVLMAYAIGLAVVDLVVYWRSRVPHLP